MVLVPCRECGSNVSNQAASCPHCGIRRPATLGDRPVFDLARVTEKISAFRDDVMDAGQHLSPSIKNAYDLSRSRITNRVPVLLTALRYLVISILAISGIVGIGIAVAIPFALYYDWPGPETSSRTDAPNGISADGEHPADTEFRYHCEAAKMDDIKRVVENSAVGLSRHIVVFSATTAMSTPDESTGEPACHASVVTNDGVMDFIFQPKLIEGQGYLAGRLVRKP